MRHALHNRHVMMNTLALERPKFVGRQFLTQSSFALGIQERFGFLKIDGEEIVGNVMHATVGEAKPNQTNRDESSDEAGSNNQVPQYVRNHGRGTFLTMSLQR